MAEPELADPLSNPDERVRLRAVQALAAQDEPRTASRLVGVLSDPNWRVRQAAVAGLVRLKATDAVHAVLAAMRSRHRDLGVLNSVIQVLARAGADTQAALLELLRDPDAELRAYAALTLGAQADARVVPALIRALDDADANVRFHAIEALKVRAGDAVEPLAGLAESGDFTLAFPALDALAVLGDSRVSHRIVPLLEDELLQDAAADALGRIGDEEAVRPLADLLNRPQAAILAAARALVALHDRCERAYRKGAYVAGLVRRAVTEVGVHNLLGALDRTSQVNAPLLAKVLGWLEGAAVDRVLADLLSKPEARKEAVEALVAKGAAATELLLRQLDVEDLGVRKAAVMALGRIGDIRAVPALLRVLAADEELAASAAGSLAMIGDPRAYAALLNLLGCRDSGVRRAAVSAINSLGHADVAADMVRLLTDASPLVRESAVRIAGYAGCPECTDLLLESCRDADDNVRKAAVEHLPYLDDRRVAAALAAALQHDHAGTRAAAARALGQADDVSVRPLLRASLNDPDPWVRYFAARSAGRRRDEQTLDALVRLAQTDAAVQVRVAAVEALGVLGGTLNVAILTSLSQDLNRDLARAALAALGALGRPDALPPLLAAARSPDPERRTDAVRALGESRLAEADETLYQTAVGDAEPEVARAAVAALERSATPEALERLVSLCAEPKWRETCITSLASLKGEQALFAARGLIHSDPNVRCAVVEALGRMKHPGAAELLSAALQDADNSVRRAAVAALAQSGRQE